MAFLFPENSSRLQKWLQFCMFKRQKDSLYLVFLTNAFQVLNSNKSPAINLVGLLFLNP